MSSSTSAPIARGQSLHAGSRSLVSRLYTLLLCITMLHATAAPLQYRPVTGTHRTEGVRASSVFTDTMTDLALAAPQTSYTDMTLTNRLIRKERKLYEPDSSWSKKTASKITTNYLDTFDRPQDASRRRCFHTTIKPFSGALCVCSITFV